LTDLLPAALLEMVADSDAVVIPADATLSELSVWAQDFGFRDDPPDPLMLAARDALRGRPEVAAALERSAGYPEVERLTHYADGREVEDARQQPDFEPEPPSRSSSDFPSPDLGVVLTEIERHLCRFVHFTNDHQPVAVALWIAHTHAADKAEQSPILNITSPVPRAGKTRLFDVLESVIRSPWRVAGVSEAVLFRKLERDHPTVLLDEADTIFSARTGQDEGLRAIFNAGNRRGTHVSRAVAQGRGFELRDFAVFGPKAVAGIGTLPDTIADRAITIDMARKRADERVERLRARTARELGTPLHDALAVLLADLELPPDPAVPDELDDRAADNWEPLLAIADGAGGDWPGRARAAAVALQVSRADREEDWGLLLLRDLHRLFEDADESWLPTSTLREGLIAMDESPWGDIRGKPLTAHYMARLLRRFGIRAPKSPGREGGTRLRGYARQQFVDAWARYVPTSSGSVPSVLSVPQREGGTDGTDGTVSWSETQTPRSDGTVVPEEVWASVLRDYPASTWDGEDNVQ
jgi:hypothetical protein